MDFRELTYFMAIAQNQRLTKAAKALYISEPALCKFLQNLEDNLGQPLFDRIGNQLILNDAGECYLEKAQEILAIKSELDQSLDDIKNRNVGCLKLAISQNRASYLLPAILPAFEKIYPRVTVSLFEGPTNKITPQLLSGGSHLSIQSYPLAESGLDFEPLESSELVLITAVSHKLPVQAVKRPGCAHPWIDINALRNEEFLLQPTAQISRAAVRTLMGQVAWSPRIKINLQDMTTILALVREDYGISLTWESHLNNIPHIRHDLAVYSIGNPIQRIGTVAAYRKGFHLTEYMKTFIQLARDFYREQEN